MKNVIFYHQKCADGVGAAFFLDEILTKGKTTIDEEFIYVPINYAGTNVNFINENLPDDVENIWFVDFCPKTRDLWEIDLQLRDRKNKFKIIILDHHKTAFDILKEIDEDWESTRGQNIYFALAKNGMSGASLVYHMGDILNKLKSISYYTNSTRWNAKSEVFNMHGFYDREFVTEIYSNIPALYFERPIATMLSDLLRIHDIWIKNSSGWFDSMYFNVFLKTFNLLDFDSFKERYANDSSNILSDIYTGKMLQQAYLGMANVCIATGHKELVYTNSGKQVHVIISNVIPGIASLFGDVWNESINENTIAIGVSPSYQNKQVGLSIRSAGECDAVVLAEALNGGGHPKASGASISLAQNHGITIQMQLEETVKYLIGKIQEVY